MDSIMAAGARGWECYGSSERHDSTWRVGSRLITPISHVVTPIISIINLLTKSP